MLKAGVVGVGVMGENHARVYTEISEKCGVKLVGVADVDQSLTKEVGKRYGVPYFNDHTELAKKELDLVSIAVPTSKHLEVAQEFIEMGTDILVEKPIADTVKNGKKIVKLAEDAGVKLMVGHIERFNPAVMQLNEIVKKDELGELLTISATRVGPLAIRIRDVGIIIDLAVHDIDVMNFILRKKVKSVKAKAGNVRHPDNVEDYALIMLDYPNGTSGVVETNWLTPHKTRNLKIVGTKGIAHVDYIDQDITKYNEHWKKEYKVDKREPLKNELEEFVRCSREGKEPLVGGEDGIHVLEVAEKAMQSAKENRIIEV